MRLKTSADCGSTARDRFHLGTKGLSSHYPSNDAFRTKDGGILSNPLSGSGIDPEVIRMKGRGFPDDPSQKGSKTNTVGGSASNALTVRPWTA